MVYFQPRRTIAKPLSKNNRILKFGGNQDKVIHPSVSLDVTKLQKNYSLKNPKFEDLENTI
jgi:hypothetical protein